MKVIAAPNIGRRKPPDCIITLRLCFTPALWLAKSLINFFWLFNLAFIQSNLAECRYKVLRHMSLGHTAIFNKYLLCYLFALSIFIVDQQQLHFLIVSYIQKLTCNLTIITKFCSNTHPITALFENSILILICTLNVLDLNTF